jgi:hypothetical protein
LKVGAEKEKVNAENASAQVEAEKCAVIASEVSEKQASCEKDLAAAEPLVEQATAALNTLNKKDLGETKVLKKPPPGMQPYHGPCCRVAVPRFSSPILACPLQVWMTSRLL